MQHAIHHLRLSHASKVPIMFWGVHGIGKSSIVRQFAQEQSLPLVNLVLSQLEAVDLLGMPYVIDHQPPSYNQEGEQRTGIPTDQIPFLPAKRTIYASPLWFPSEPSLIFLDELNRAQRYEINAVHQLACEHRLHQQQLPEGSFVVAACNPPDFEYGLTGFGDPFLSRFAHIEFHIDYAQWLEWAGSKKLQPKIVEYLSETSDQIGNCNFKFKEIIERIKPNPRAWEYVSRVRQASEQLEKNGTPVNKTALHAFTVGLIGTSAANIFMQHLQSVKLGERPLTPDQIIIAAKKGEQTFGIHRLSDTVRNQITTWKNQNLIPLIKQTITMSSKHVEDHFIRDGGIETYRTDTKAFHRKYGSLFELLKLCPKPIQQLWINSLGSNVWTDIASILDSRYQSIFSGA